MPRGALDIGPLRAATGWALRAGTLAGLPPEFPWRGGQPPNRPARLSALICGAPRPRGSALGRSTCTKREGLALAGDPVTAAPLEASGLAAPGAPGAG